ncbi:MAG: recombinase family protein [Pseudomonadota bacterium]
MARAYSYLRFSTPEQARGDSFRRQTRLAQEYAQRHGLTLDDKLTFHDLGVSGYRGANAETGQLGYFLEAVRCGLVEPGSYLLVESLDRISRQAARRALKVLEGIVDEGINVVTLMDGRTYSAETLDSDPFSLMLALLTFIRANEESATKARRLSASWENKRARAAERPVTSVAPAWLRLDKDVGAWDVIQDRADVVRRIYAMADAGVGQNAIAESLNKGGVPVFGHGSRKAAHWHRSYVAKILASSTVVGTLTPHKLEYVDGRQVRRPLEPLPNYYPAIVDKALWERVQDVKAARPAAPRHRAGHVQNVLAGLATCPVCEGAMTRVMKGKKGGRPYLVCQRAKTGAGCTYRAVRCDDVEGALLSRGAELLASVPTGREDAGLDVRLAELDDAILGLEQDVDGLLDLLQQTRSQAAMDRLRNLEAELDGARAERLALIQEREAKAGPMVRRRVKALERALTEEPLDKAAVNAALRAICDRVTVNWGTGFLQFQWRHGGRSEVIFAWPDEARAA